MFDPDEFCLSLLLVDARPFHPDCAAGSFGAVSHGSLLWLDSRHIGGGGSHGLHWRMSIFIYIQPKLGVFVLSHLADCRVFLGWILLSRSAKRKSFVVCCFFPFMKLQEFSLTSTPADPTKLDHNWAKATIGNQFYSFYIVSNINFLLTRNDLQIHPHAPLYRFLFFFYFFFLFFSYPGNWSACKHW